MSAKKKVVPAAASAKLPKGVATYHGRFYTNDYVGSYDTVEEAVAIRAKAMDFKASLKDVARMVAGVPAGERAAHGFAQSRGYDRSGGQVSGFRLGASINS